MRNNLSEVTSMIESNHRRGGEVREWLVGMHAPLTFQKIRSVLSVPGNSDSPIQGVDIGIIRRVDELVGWPTDTAESSEMPWDDDFKFMGEGADERFRGAYFSSGSRRSLDNFVALFRKAPSLRPSAGLDFMTRFNVTKPALNRLFALDPSLVAGVGLYAQTVTIDTPENQIAKFDTVSPSGRVHNDALSMLRQAYMIYGGLVLPDDEARHMRLQGYEPSSDSKPVTSVDRYIEA